MDGIIPLWKEAGMTSHDCVFKLRKILNMKKIGHSGTLDPAVNGVLPICIGKGTKVIEYLQDSGKVYQGEVVLGVATTTEDATGEVVASAPLEETSVTEDMIDQAMNQFVGTITQIPPMYSAVKVNGKRLYEYARAGETVERPKRQAVIKEFKRISPLSYHPETKTLSFQFIVSCGKGTYVRTLAVDTGKTLGYPAHMSQLTRLESGGFKEQDSVTLEEIRTLVENETYSFVHPIEEGVKDLVQRSLSQEQYEDVRHGRFLSQEDLGLAETTELVAIFYQELLVGIYGPHPKQANMYKPVKIIRNYL